MHKLHRPIIYRLLQVSDQMLKTREIYASIVGVTAPQFSIMTVISEHPDIHVNEVADILNVSGPFVTKELGRLITAGLISKRTSTEDRRRMLLNLTELGRERFVLANNDRLLANDHIFNSFSESDLQVLSDDLTKLLKGLNRAIHHLEKPD